jgi:hypothetical protein
MHVQAFVSRDGLLYAHSLALLRLHHQLLRTLLE